MTSESSTNDQGADPSADVKKQNPGEITTADQVSKHDPHKVEKIAEAGEPAVNHNAENPT